MATYPTAINNSGTVVGYYTVPICNPDGDCPESHGFTYANGLFRSVDFPNASSTSLVGINNNGIIIGNETTSIPDPNFPYGTTRDHEGFYFTPRGQTDFTIIPYQEDGFTPSGINDSNFLIGYGDVSPILHYSIGAIGPLESISPYVIPGYLTGLTGVDNGGDFVGYLIPVNPGPFRSQLPATQGFLNLHGQVFTFTFPGATETYFYGMNNQGQILGSATGRGAFLTTVDQVINTGKGLGESFYTVPPCRVVDTRLVPSALGGPALQAGEKRTFDTAGVCGIPRTAAAVVMNVTVVGPTAAGFLTLGPSDQALPNTSAINFNAGVVRSNNTIMKVSFEGEAGLMVHNGSSGAVQVILDVSGYFQ